MNGEIMNMDRPEKSLSTPVVERCTGGGPGFGSEVMTEARWSLAYHQCKNCRKKMPVDSDVDRMTENQLNSLPTIINTRWRQLQHIHAK